MAQIIKTPAYQRLAAAAAAALGASSPDVTRAILAQWQCELGNGDAYPPRRNNPGNIARGFASAFASRYPFRVEYPNPQPGNPIVTYATPEVGAAAYAAGIREFTRYRKALKAARDGNGAAFLRELTAAGWGTGYGCALGVYRANGGTSVAPGGSVPSGGSSSGGKVGTGTATAGEGLDPMAWLVSSLLDNLGPLLGRAVFLAGLMGGLLLGTWLLFREPIERVVVPLAKTAATRGLAK